MAALVASSRVRASPRASRSVATFDVAIIRNTPTIDRTIHNGSSNASRSTPRPWAPGSSRMA
jgi:hypothetical protein